jgi:hypothetical protein
VDPRYAWVTLAGALTAVGGGAIVAFAVASSNGQTIPRLWFVLAWSAFTAGLIILSFLLAPPLRRPFVRSAERYGEWRRARLVPKARFRQRLRCNTNGHKWTEEVVPTSAGWLAHEGAIRRCPYAAIPKAASRVARSFQATPRLGSCNA